MLHFGLFIVVGQTWINAIHTNTYFAQVFLQISHWSHEDIRSGSKEIRFYPAAAAAAKSHQSCLTLCDPIDGSPPGSSVPGILQARTRVGCHFLLQCMKVKSESEVAQSCPTLRDRMDCSLPGSSIRGVFQARVLEWVAIAFSRFYTAQPIIRNEQAIR